ncbi:lipopolysaccharide biosynthesis protein [Vibrio cholerae]|uniref:lipopolysaccharide biosynthesis protein n=1 Tax=Vibrio cholerae TaxID=666 RepID=UPI000E6D221B|nr:oligosaccharide flippase family protein [Vibrio cholerae]RJK82506.1 polysaccharide biosynthesis protein [Vibrio cholerae]
MSLAKKSLVYLLSNIINASIPFLLLPILTRALSPSEYGQIAMFQTLVAGLAAFVGLNTVGAANRKYYDDGNNLYELSQYNSACLHILIGSTLAIMGIAAVLSEQLSEFLSIPISWINSAVLFSALSFVINLRLGQWQVRGEALKFGAFQIGNSLFNMVFSLLLVIVLHHGAQGRIDAQLVVAALFSVLALLMLAKDKVICLFCWRSDYLKQALQFGGPLIPHIFGFFLLSAVDRFIINQELGLAQTGVYMVAVQISMALSIVFDAINKAYVPWLFEILKRDTLAEKQKVVKYTYFYFLLLLLVVPIPFFIGPFALVLIAGDVYIASGKVIGLLCLGQIFGGMYLMVTNYIFYAKKTGYLAFITISSGLLNVVLLLVLVKDMGTIGAALAFVLSKGFQFVFTWFLACLSVAMPWFKVNACREKS